MNDAPVGGRKEQLLDEFNAIVSETERLLKTATRGEQGTTRAAADGAVGVVEPAGLGTQLDESLKAARERLELLEDLVAQRTQATVKAADAYVRQHPWQVVGIAAGIGLLIGLLLRRR